MFNLSKIDLKTALFTIILVLFINISMFSSNINVNASKSIKSLDFAFEKQIISNCFNGAIMSTAIDIDSDNDVDIIGAASYSNTISLWLNNGQQSFAENVITNNFDGVYNINVVDLDKDGDFDILAAGNSINELAWWENNGETGSNLEFSKIVIASYNRATSINYCDIDGDNDLDLLSTARTDISWWENNGSQNFTRNILFTRSYRTDVQCGYDIYAVDFDKDGRKDILCGENYYGGESDFGPNIYIWKQEDNKSFTKNDIAEYTPLHGFDVGDIDKDGYIEFCATNPRDNSIHLFKNLGNLSFEQKIISSDIITSNDVEIADLDNDSDLDLIAPSYYSPNGSIYWFENIGNYNFTKKVIDSDFPEAFSVSTVDIDNDNDLDILGCSRDNNTIALYKSRLILNTELQPGDSPPEFTPNFGLNYIIIVFTLIIAFRKKKFNN